MTLGARHDAYLEVVGRDLATAARRQARIRLRRRGRLRVAALSVAAVVVLGGSALAGSALLGMPAPRIVQSTLDSLWPRAGTVDLAPVRGAARAVARFDGLTLYRSPGRSTGTVCLSIVPAGGVRLDDGGGTSCWRQRDTAWPIGVLTRVMGDRQLVFGRLRSPAGNRIALQWRGAESVQIPIGVDGYFLGVVQLAGAKPGTRPLLGTLRLIDGDGFVITQREVIRLTAN